MTTTATSIILRNEPFGGIYFNQKNGRMVMVDQEGFFTLLRYLNHQKLSSREDFFSHFFFNDSIPDSTIMRIDPSIAFSHFSSLQAKSPAFIDLSLNNECNSYCKYCYMNAKEEGKGEHLLMNDFEYLLKQIERNRVLQVALGGGEPTIHPQFTNILKKLRLKANIIPNYTTNGLVLTPDIIKATKKYCGAVAVSYHEQKFEQIFHSARKFIESKIITNLHVVLLKSRMKTLAERLEPFCELGISNIVLLTFKPAGRGALLNQEMLTQEDQRELANQIKKLIVFRKKYKVRLSIDACSSFMFKRYPFLPQSMEGCTGGLYSAYISWDLTMKPCSFMRNQSGVSLKTSSLLDAWNSTIFQNFRKQITTPNNKECQACYHYAICRGGCPIYPEIVFCPDKGLDYKYTYKTYKN